jgi:hypothetical protein
MPPERYQVLIKSSPRLGQYSPESLAARLKALMELFNISHEVAMTAISNANS